MQLQNYTNSKPKSSQPLTSRSHNTNPKFHSRPAFVKVSDEVVPVGFEMR